MKKPNQAAAVEPTPAPSTALATSTTDALATSTTDALAPKGPDDELSVLAGLAGEGDGLGPLDDDDIKIPTYVFNMKGLDKAGDPIPKNVFYDTLSETTKKRVRAGFILRHKTNTYQKYDTDKARNEMVCQSHDLKIGTMRDGTVRPCKGCPDALWYKKRDDDGKERNTRNCSVVDTVFASDLDDGKLFTIRFKKSARRAWVDHINKHHIDKFKLASGKRANVPLFAYEVLLGLKMSDDATHALPTIEKVRVVTREEALSMASDMRTMMDRMVELTERAAAHDQDDADGGVSSGGGDTSFDTDKFTRDEGQDFVDTPAGDAA